MTMTNTNPTVYFDMDGTLADTYGIPNWLEMLQTEQSAPYLQAVPLLNMSLLARRIHQLQQEGIRVCILSWLSRGSSKTYAEEVTAVKKEWLRQHLPSVQFDELHIVPYGTPKENFCQKYGDVLIDDDSRNRTAWSQRGGWAVDAPDALRFIAEMVNCAKLHGM